jgi:nucleolar protein TMA23
MNAHALLTSQGWRGTGHSLHPTSDDTGLKHPLLIQRDGNDGSGLGSKKDHKAEAWWMNAFDQALKGIDTSSGSMKQTVGNGKLDLDKITAKGANKYVGNRGLYTCFVRGGLLSGTVGESKGGLLTPPDSGAGTPAAEATEGNKKKTETKEERKTRREAKRLKKAEKVARKEADAKAAAKLQKRKAKEAMKAGETKGQRRARRDARRARKEEKRRRKGSDG